MPAEPFSGSGTVLDAHLPPDLVKLRTLSTTLSERFTKTAFFEIATPCTACFSVGRNTTWIFGSFEVFRNSLHEKPIRSPVFSPAWPWGVQSCCSVTKRVSSKTPWIEDFGGSGILIGSPPLSGKRK